jgi:hypothetical protein
MHIELIDPDHATLAAQWCKRNYIPYKLEYWGWPGLKKYKFLFDTESDMMMFSLRWL